MMDCVSKFLLENNISKMQFLMMLNFHIISMFMSIFLTFCDVFSKTFIFSWLFLLLSFFVVFTNYSSFSDFENPKLKGLWEP